MSSISGNSIISYSYARALNELKSNFQTLSQQVATGKVADNYAGLGSARGTSLAVRGKLADLESYNANIDQANVRLSLINLSLEGIAGTATDTRADLDPNAFVLIGGKKTAAQETAATRLDAALSMLNTNAGGVYLFGGRNVSDKPVATMDEILNGSGTQAGLTQLINERRQADLGADGRGRLTKATATGTSVALAETTTPNAFGLKLTSAVSTNASAFSVTGPTGSPPGIGIDLVAAPQAGDQVRVTVTLPDGTTEDIALTASNNAPASKEVATVSGKQLPAGAALDTPLTDPLLGLSVGNVITINGQEIEVVASGAVGNQVNATDTLDDLLGKIEGLSDVASATFDPETRKVTITSAQGTDLQITGTVATKLGVAGIHEAEEVKGNEFQIVYNPDSTVDLDATAQNMAAALDSAVMKLGATSLTAASAMAASNDFFDMDATNPPQRVDGPPFDSATGLRDATPTDTMVWYRGDAGTDSARPTQSARIDKTVSAAYGVRASEEGIRDTIKTLATFAALSFETASDDDAKQLYTELTDRVRTGLGGSSGPTPLEGIAAEFAGITNSVAAAQDRHEMSKAVLETALDAAEGVDTDAAALELQAINTRLQASFQVASMISQLSLVNYV